MNRENYFSNSGVRNLFVILYNFHGNDPHCFIKGSIFCISLQISLWYKSDRKQHLLCRLCKDDGKYVALENLFLASLLKGLHTKPTFLSLLAYFLLNVSRLIP
jgi:hypothetical protein